MIGFLVLALCFTSLNSQYTAQYTYEDEYKTLLYEMSGTFGGSIVETIVNGEVVDHVSHSYTSNIWPVNTTIFPGKEVFFVKEQVSTDIVRKSLFTVYREDSTKVIINRYNFTTGVSINNAHMSLAEGMILQILYPQIRFPHSDHPENLGCIS